MGLKIKPLPRTLKKREAVMIHLQPTQRTFVYQKAPPNYFRFPSMIQLLTAGDEQEMGRALSEYMHSYQEYKSAGHESRGNNYNIV